MTESATATTPPASTGGFDITAFEAMLNKSVASAVKPLQDRLDTLQSSNPSQSPAQQEHRAAPAAQQAAGGLTLEQLTKVLDQRDQQRQVSDQRARFVGDKLKDLPSVYQGQLGNDPAQWAADEQRIRAGYRDDLKRIGATVPDIGGDGGESTGPGGTVASPIAGVDLSKMSGTGLIQMGLKTSKPARVAGSATVAKPIVG